MPTVQVIASFGTYRRGQVFILPEDSPFLKTGYLKVVETTTPEVFDVFQLREGDGGGLASPARSHVPRKARKAKVVKDGEGGFESGGMPESGSPEGDVGGSPADDVERSRDEGVGSVW